MTAGEATATGRADRVDCIHEARDFRAGLEALRAGELYCITDCGMSGLSHLEQARRLLSAGVRVIQLRDKHAGDAELLPQARVVAQLCREAGTTFIVNDRPVLARDAGAHGVHLGQGDGPLAKAREILGPTAIIGRSTHSEAQLREALLEGPDYLAVGPVFGTSTKENPDPATGTELVALALSLAGTVPVVAIGGIEPTNIARVPAGASAAVISAVLHAADIEGAARAMRFLALRRHPQ